MRWTIHFLWSARPVAGSSSLSVHSARPDYTATTFHLAPSYGPIYDDPFADPKGHGVTYCVYDDEALAQQLDHLQKLHQHHYALPPPVYIRTGYIATEEYILRVHAESTHPHRRRPAPLDLRAINTRRAGNVDEELLNANS